MRMLTSVMDSGDEREQVGRRKSEMEVPGLFDETVVCDSTFSSLGDWDYDDF